MKKKYIKYIFVLLIAVFAAVLRINALTKLGTDYDEEIYVPLARKYADFINSGNLHGIINYTENMEHPLFIKLIYGFAISIVEKFNIIVHSFELQQTITRVVSMLFGVANTILIAILNPIAGLFMAISSWNVKYSSEAMFDSGASFFATLGIFCFIKSKKPMDKLMIVSAISMGLAFGSKYITATTAITILPFLFIKTKNNIKNFFLYGIIAFGVFFLSDPILWNHTISRLTHSILFHKSYSTGAHVKDVAYPFFQQLVWLIQPVVWDREVFSIKFDTIILLLGLLGSIKLFKKSKILGCWFFINLIFLLIYPTKWPQYTLMFIPVLCLSAGDYVLFLKSKIDSFIEVRSDE